MSVSTLALTPNEIKSPYELIFDQKKNRLLVIDGNILKSVCLSTCSVSTIAGMGTRGCTLLMQTGANSGLTIDQTDGSIIIADSFNNRILRVDETKDEVKIIAGSSTGTCSDADTKFKQPCGVCCDSKGNVFVADCLNQRIVRLLKAANGTYSGSTVLTMKNSDENEFLCPVTIAADQRNNVVYAACNSTTLYSNTVGKLDVSVDVPSAPPLLDICSNSIDALTVSGQSGLIYFIDDKDDSLWCLDVEASKLSKSLWTRILRITSNFSLLLAHTHAETQRVVVGQKDCIGVDGPVSLARFGFPVSITIDEPSGVLYISDHASIRKVVGVIPPLVPVFVPS